MAGISSTAANFGKPENKRKFVGLEIENDFDLSWYEFKYRNEDPQIGRFVEIDPISSEYVFNSTYAYAENRPINGIDLEGLEWWATVFDNIGSVVDDVWYNGVKPGLDWINQNLNPLVPAAELVSGKSYESNFTEDKSRKTSTAELILTIVPGGKVEKAGEKLLAQKVVASTAKPAEEAVVKTETKAAGQEIKATVQEVKVSQPYKRPANATNSAQRSSVQGKPCVTCGQTAPKMVADHKKQLVQEYYETGTIDKKKMKTVEAVQPQCPSCSAKQGAEASRYSKAQKKKNGLSEE